MNVIPTAKIIAARTRFFDGWLVAGVAVAVNWTSKGRGCPARAGI